MLFDCDNLCLRRGFLDGLTKEGKFKFRVHGSIPNDESDNRSSATNPSSVQYNGHTCEIVILEDVDTKAKSRTSACKLMAWQGLRQITAVDEIEGGGGPLTFLTRDSKCVKDIGIDDVI